MVNYDEFYPAGSRVFHHGIVIFPLYDPYQPEA